MAAAKSKASKATEQPTEQPIAEPQAIETPEGAPNLITTADGAIVNITDGVVVYEPTRHPPAALAVKVARVMGDITRVEKRGTNTEQRYEYAQESDVMEMLRPILAKHGLAVFIECVHHTADEIGKTRNGNAFMRHRVRMQYTLVDADTGGAWTMVYPGEANDSGDKGIYKAMTGATKYWALKAFLIGTGDDPERDTGEGDMAPKNAGASSSSGTRSGGQRNTGQGGQRGPSTTDPMSDAQNRKLFAVARTIDEILGTEAATDHVRESIGNGSATSVAGPGEPPKPTLTKAEASELIEKLVKREGEAKANAAVQGPAGDGDEGDEGEPEGAPEDASSEEAPAEQGDAFDKPAEPAADPFEEEDDLPF